MLLQNSFTVPVPVDEAWPLLLDIERMARCMPGASLEAVDGDSFTGRVTVKVGPISVNYRGRAQITSLDHDARLLRVAASGRESRGSGTVRAEVVTRLQGHGDVTAVAVSTELDITGRPAQFGRGVLNDVAGRVVDQFAARLHEELAATRDAEWPQVTRTQLAADMSVEDGRSRLAAVPSEPPDALNLVPLALPFIRKAVAAIGPIVLLVLLVVAGRRRGPRHR